MFFKVLGSSNPTRLFVAGIHGKDDFCFTLEMPDPYSEKALKIALHILRSISLSSSRR
ncbi:Uncharacterised protein [uncultured archaeon]|nr:Uncharacterised protein [uncultured archaeon]